MNDLRIIICQFQFHGAQRGESCANSDEPVGRVRQAHRADGILNNFIHTIAFLFGNWIRDEDIFSQLHHADIEADFLLNFSIIAGDKFGASPSDIENQKSAMANVQTGSNRQKRKSGFFIAGNNFNRNAKFIFDEIDEIVGICCSPQCHRANSANLIDSILFSNFKHLANDSDISFHRFRAYFSGAIQVFTQAGDFGSIKNRLPFSFRSFFSNMKFDGVGSDVHDCIIWH